MTTILIVDDEPTVRALVRDVLELDGYDIVEAPDGVAALAAVQEHQPNLMVLDVMMPGMSGLDVLRELRRERSGTELPIILLTAASDDDTTWAGWTAGASVFLPKPFDPSHLLDWVERLISGETGGDMPMGAVGQSPGSPEGDAAAADDPGKNGSGASGAATPGPTDGTAPAPDGAHPATDEPGAGGSREPSVGNLLSEFGGLRNE